MGSEKQLPRVKSVRDSLQSYISAGTTAILGQLPRYQQPSSVTPIMDVTDAARSDDSTAANNNGDPTERAAWYVELIDRIADHDWSSRSTKRFSIVLVILGVISWLFFCTSYLNRRVDFMQDYYAVQAWRNGASIYGEEVVTRAVGERGIGFANFHPPFSIMLFIPLGFFSYTTAYISYSLLALLIHSLICSLIVRGLTGSNLLFLPVLGLSLLTPILNETATQGNTSILMAGGLILAWRLLLSGRERSAGHILALCGLLKMFPLIFGVFLLVTRRWKALTSYICTLVSCILLTLLVIGHEDVTHYLMERMGENVGEYGFHGGNLGFSGVVRPFLIYNPVNVIMPVVHAPMLASFIVSALTLLLGYTLVKAGMRLGKVPGAFTLLFSFYLTGMLLVSPIVWQHSLEVLLLPFLYLLLSAKKNRSRGELAGVILAIALILTSEWDQAWQSAQLLPPRTGLPYWYFIATTKTQSLGLVLTFFLLARRCQMESSDTRLCPLQGEAEEQKCLS